MIEKIKILKIKHKEHFKAIQLDNGETLKIPYSIENIFDLSTDREIDRLEYNQMKEESDRFICREKALSYLAIRDRSKYEIETYLKKKGFSANIIKETLIKIKDSGYINDYEYALKYLKGQKKKKTVGVNILKNKLLGKGIPKEKIKKALKDSGAYETDIEELYHLALKKYNSYKEKNNYKSRLFFFLKQRGFDNNDINIALNMLENEIKE